MKPINKSQVRTLADTPPIGTRCPAGVNFQTLREKTLNIIYVKKSGHIKRFVSESVGNISEVKIPRSQSNTNLESRLYQGKQLKYNTLTATVIRMFPTFQEFSILNSSCHHYCLISVFQLCSHQYGTLVIFRGCILNILDVSKLTFNLLRKYFKNSPA